MLKNKRKEIIDYVKAHASYINTCREIMDIFDGNLMPYIDLILRNSLSPNYYNAIKDRVLPINILQRYVGKVANTYVKPPKRMASDTLHQEMVDWYVDTISFDQSALIADQYSHMYKGFAWEPFINKQGMPDIRELAFDKFLVMSDSKSNPEEETIFIKMMGKKNDSDDSLLLHVYTDEEFDAFYLDGTEATEYLKENEGVNPVGVIPFVYGKRQKNKLIPVLDSDMLAVVKSIPCMLTDGAGAQMFQAFTILYGIDVNVENLKMSPNAFWSIKSDQSSDKNPQIGSIKPEADTQKILEFVVSIFTIWLETKGIRVGSMGSVDGGSVASGISKIIDEMDTTNLTTKSQTWFKKDEKEFWYKMGKIHNYWIESGLVEPSLVPPMIVGDVDVSVEFEKPEAAISRAEEIANIKQELELKTMTLKQAILKLHPSYTEEEIEEVLQESRTILDFMDETNGKDDSRDQITE